MKMPTKARPVALLLFGVYVALFVSVHGMPLVAASTTVAALTTSKRPATPSASDSGTSMMSVVDPAGIRCALDDAALNAPAPVTTSIVPETPRGGPSPSGVVPMSAGALPSGIERRFVPFLRAPGLAAAGVSGRMLTVARSFTGAGCRTATELLRKVVLAIAWVCGVTPPPQGAAETRLRLRSLRDLNQDVCRITSFAHPWSGSGSG